jgi:hypothetical protein
LRKLVLHIGAPKAASTSIQTFLGRNAGRLLAQGIIVLDRELTPASEDGSAPMGADADTEETLLDPGLSGEGKIERISARYLAAIDRAVDRFDCHTVVISAENLARLAPDRALVIAAFARLMPRLDLRVLFYVRRPDYWLESAWKQWTLKVTHVPPAEWAASLAEEGAPDFLGTARDWKTMAGPDHFVIRLLDPKALWGIAVLQDFAALIGATDLDFDIANENPMLHPALLRFFQRHHKVLFSDAHDSRLFDWAERLRLFAPSGRRLLSEPERRGLLAALADRNRALLTEFFPDSLPALLPSWCPVATDEPQRELGPPSPWKAPRVVAGLERAAARALALALKFKRR